MQTQIQTNFKCDSCGQVFYGEDFENQQLAMHSCIQHETACRTIIRRELNGTEWLYCMNREEAQLHRMDVNIDLIYPNWIQNDYPFASIAEFVEKMRKSLEATESLYHKAVQNRRTLLAEFPVNEG